MKNKLIALLFLIFLYNASAQIYFVEEKIDLGNFQANNKVAIQTKIKNDTPYNAKLKKMNMLNTWSAISIDTLALLEIGSNSEKSVTILFEPIHNIAYNEVIYLNYDYSIYNTTAKINIVANVKYNDEYDSVFNLFKSDLRNGLYFKVKNHKSYSYKDARTFMWSQLDNVNGYAECVYTGRKVFTNGIPDVNTTNFNTEHTWPQSLGAENEPEKSDLFHMRPCYEVANTKRGNYPFGYVVNGVTYEDGGSKLGRNKNNSIVFEVRDINKGDIARGLFYFALRYKNPNNYLDEQYNDLVKWHFFDLPDEKEKKRNNDLASYQLVRSPFIDHPELILRDPFSFNSKVNLAYLSSDTLKIDLSDVGFSKTVPIYLISNYYTLINSISVVSNDNVFELVSFEKQVIENGLNIINIQAKAIKDEPSNGKLLVELADGKVLSAVLHTPKGILNIDDKRINISNLYPNPANNQITISIPELTSGAIEIILLNNLGQLIEKKDLIINENCFNYNLSQFPNGAYFYLVKSNNKEYFGKIVKE